MGQTRFHLLGLACLLFLPSRSIALRFYSENLDDILIHGEMRLKTQSLSAKLTAYEVTDSPYYLRAQMCGIVR